MMTETFATPPGSKREKSAHGRHRSVVEVQAAYGIEFPFRVAAPSFVIPAGAAENARFLAGRFPEICLLFFETEACLAYTNDDLPPDLAQLDAAWHVHLPLDLPWSRGLDDTWDALSRLMKMAAHLSPHAWVLHPPTEPDMLLPLAARFRDAGVDPADVLLENVEETDLCALWPEAREGGYSTCLDLGHILAYGQRPVLDLPGLWETVRMLHIYAPLEGSGRHTGLRALDKSGTDMLKDVLARFQGDTVVLEVFNETELFDSLALLADLVSTWRREK